MEEDLYKNHFKSQNKRWLVTFADLLSVIICFMVLIYSHSEADPKKMREITESLDKRFANSKKKKMNIISVDYLGDIIKSKINDAEINKFLSFKKIDHKIIISFNKEKFFDGTEDNFSIGAISIIFFLESVLSEVDNKMEITTKYKNFGQNDLLRNIISLELKRLSKITNEIKKITGNEQVRYILTQSSNLTESDFIDIIIYDY